MTYSSALCLGLFLFLGILILHIFVWRFLQPKREMAWLFTLFGALPFLLALFLTLLGMDAETAMLSAFLAAALGAVYVISYPAAQAESPTLLLLRFLDSAPGKRRSEAEIRAFFANRSSLADRAADLQRDGLVAKGKLTLSGEALRIFFTYFRRALRIEGNG